MVLGTFVSFVVVENFVCLISKAGKQREGETDSFWPVASLPKWLQCAQDKAPGKPAVRS